MTIDQVQRIKDLAHIEAMNPNNPWGKGLVDDYNLKYGEAHHIGPETQGILHFDINEAIIKAMNE